LKTDYELTISAKNGDRKAEEELFTRYAPFAYKHYAKVKKDVFGISLEKEEFLSESYFEFKRALTYANPEKIYDQENWKFLGVFGYFLNSYRDRVMKETLKHSVEGPLLVSGDEGEEYCVVDAQLSSTTESQPERAAIEKDQCSRFYKRLTLDEKRVLDERIRVRLRGKPTALTTVAENLGYSFSKVQSLNKSLERKFQAHA
jgi:hypothetical protein